MTTLPNDLADAIARISRHPFLLVATDYDGTLAPIVPDPADAHADEAAVVALRLLARLPHTEVSVISGRGLAELRWFLPASESMYLVGSHGAEFEDGRFKHLDADAADLRERLGAALEDIAARADGLRVEWKPTGVALHVRTAAPADAAAATEAALAGPATWPGVSVKPGHEVTEFSVLDVDKGRALQEVRRRVGADGVLFMGDDQTDEDAFALLGPDDVGIRIGEGDTTAGYRIPDQSMVPAVLTHLAELRISGPSHAGEPVDIRRHTMLSDQRTIALLAPGGRINWFCPPRIDAPALFADLLGGPEAGHWTVCPKDRRGAGEPAVPRYEGDTLIAVTEWEGLRVTDYLDCAGDRPRQRAASCELVRVLEGDAVVRVEFSPRLDFGRAATGLWLTDDGLSVVGGHDTILLRSPGVRWRIESRGRNRTAVAEIDLADVDGPVVLELRYGQAFADDPSIARPASTPRAEPIRREATARFWQDWADGIVADGPHAALVRRSAVLIRGLCHGPTGAIAAAATTSLPEWIGGVRNWDYRFCWPRDAAMAAAALVDLGQPDVAVSLLDWLDRVVERLPSPESLAPLYTVAGEELGPEGEIGELSGYADSRPVRVGNAAAQQVQLDVFGPIADLIARLVDGGVPLTPVRRHLVRAMGTAVRRRWRDPDHGIWEPRLPPTHHVHSKVMSWTTIDRCRRIAERVGEPDLAPPAALLEEIREDVLTHAWDPASNTITATYAGRGVDAAVLWVGLSGMLAADDPRFAGTVDAVERTLRQGCVVYRYLGEDGLPGREGGFNICTTWHVRALALVGRRDEARDLLEQYARLAGPTGLMSEEHDPDADRSLGNVPQAYSHLGLIEAVRALQGD